MGHKVETRILHPGGTQYLFTEVDLLGVDTSWVAAAVSVKHVGLFVVV